MNETEAYLWAHQALRPLKRSGCELEHFESALDLVASAVLEAHKKGREEGTRAAGRRGIPTVPDTLQRRKRFLWRGR